MDIHGTELSAHIRSLLLDYVHCHITRDYVQFTHSAVSELLPSHKTLTYDPTSLTLPADPFTKLSQLLHLQDLPSYDERLPTSQETRSLLKAVSSSIHGTSRFQKMDWSSFVGSDVGLEDEFYQAEPILTRRAVRETPQIGRAVVIMASGYHRSKRSTIPESFEAIAVAGMGRVDVQPVQEPEVTMYKVLDLTFQHREQDRLSVRDLLKSVVTIPRPPPQNMSKPRGHRHEYLPPSLQGQNYRPPTPLPESPPLEPIFPRESPLRRKLSLGIKRKRSVEEDKIVKNRKPSLSSMAEIPKLLGPPDLQGSTLSLPVDNEELDGDLYAQNMLMVDGWQTIVTSSPSMISVHSDDEDIDQLADMFPSSPDTEISCAMNLTCDVESSKLHGVLIPRARQIGGNLGRGSTIARPLGTIGEKLGTFLVPLIVPQLPSVDFSILGSNGTTRSERNNELDIGSICNQAPMSGLGSCVRISRADSSPDEMFGGDDEVRRLYTPGAREFIGSLNRGMDSIMNPTDLIRSEKLFDDQELVDIDKGEAGRKDAGVRMQLMSVPVLPAPNSYSRVMELKRFGDFVKESVNGIDDLGMKTPFSRLRLPMVKKAKGLASLRVALSWVTFTRTTPLPSNAEVVGVDTIFQAEAHNEEDGVQRLMQRWFDTGETKEGDGVEFQEGRWRTCGSGPSEDNDDSFSPEIAKCEIILTREERIGLLARSGEFHSGRVEDEGREAEGEEENSSAEKEVPICATPTWPATDDSRNSTSSFERTTRPVDVLDSIGDEKGGYDELSTGYGDGLTGLRRYTDDDGNKENCWPPGTDNSTSAFYVPALDDSVGMQDYATLEETYFSDILTDGLTDDDDDGGTFEPLSFSYDSQAYQTLSARSSRAFPLNTTGVGLDSLSRTQDIELSGGVDIYDAQSFASQPLELPNKYSSDINSLDARKTMILDQNFDPSASSRLVSQSLGVEGFAKLRAKAITSRSLDPLSVASGDTDLPALQVPVRDERTEVATALISPQELYDRRTLLLPPNRMQPSTIHRYMASLDVLQKQVLVRSLHSQECRVDLVGRESLGGVDLILDPYTSVIFAPLLSLSADHKTLLARLSTQTWRYTSLLVVFEAYPSSKSSRTSSRIKRRVAGDEPELYAYTPPVVKAIKKFRRDLDIAEACGTNNSRCEIWYAFADTVVEAAAYARLFGDGAEARDRTRGALWGTREWLDLDMSEDEPSLACFQGLNSLSASIILSQVTFQEFLDLPPEERIDSFGHFVGEVAINMFNAEVAQKLEDIAALEGNTYL